MIPLRDSVRSSGWPVVTGLLIAADVAVFFYELALGPALEQFVEIWGFVPARYFVLAQIDPAGAYLVLFPHAQVLTLVLIVFFIDIIEVPAVLYLGLWFVMQLLSGTLAAAIAGGSLREACHGHR